MFLAWSFGCALAGDFMSYAQQPNKATPRKTLTPRSGDAFEAERCKIQDAVKGIQQHAADIRKEANLLSAMHGSVGKGKEKVQAAARDAASMHDVALAALQGLSRATTSTGGVDGGSLSVEEQNSRKFMHQKLMEMLVASVKAVDQASLSFDAAESDAMRKQAAENSMKTPLVTAEVGNLEPALPPAKYVPPVPVEEATAAEGADLEVGQQSQAVALAQDDAMSAETEIHVAIAEEYARDLTNLNQDMQSLQRAMVDLADVTTSQGEVLDSIENNMSAAVESTTQANTELVQSAQQQRTGTKRFMYLLAIVGSVAAIGTLFS